MATCWTKAEIEWKRRWNTTRKRGTIAVLCEIPRPEDRDTHESRPKAIHEPKSEHRKNWFQSVYAFFMPHIHALKPTDTGLHKEKVNYSNTLFLCCLGQTNWEFWIDEVSGPGQLYFIFTAITYSAGLCAQPYKCPTTKQIRIRFDCHFKRCDPIKMGEITWWEFVADCAWPNCPGALCLVRHHCNNRNRVSKCSSVVTMEIHKAFQCQLV